MKLTGERPMEGATPDSLLALHDALSRVQQNGLIKQHPLTSFCAGGVCSAATAAATSPTSNAL